MLTTDLNSHAVKDASSKQNISTAQSCTQVSLSCCSSLAKTSLNPSFSSRDETNELSCPTPVMQNQLPLCVANETDHGHFDRVYQKSDVVPSAVPRLAEVAATIGTFLHDTRGNRAPKKKKTGAAFLKPNHRFGVMKQLGTVCTINVVVNVPAAKNCTLPPNWAGSNNAPDGGPPQGRWGWWRQGPRACTARPGSATGPLGQPPL